MKHGPNSRRPRSRGNGKRHPMHNNNRGHTFESNGPEVKVRGTAQQVLEKYLALARDATSAGEHITAEGYFQYAEHYYRVLNEADHNRGHGGHGYGQHQHQNQHQHQQQHQQHQQQHHQQQQQHHQQQLQPAVETPSQPNGPEPQSSGPGPGTDPSHSR